MTIHFIRHANFVLKTGAVREMVDPMLGRARVAPAVPNTPNAKPKTPSSSCRSFARTGGRHATGEIGAQVDPVSGFVVRAEGSPSPYVAGDTIWCDEVEEALRTHPDVIIANAGAAQFLEGGPITMTAGDVARGCRAATGARVIAVHMDAINHCLPTRRELAQELGEQGLAGKAEMSTDGETLETSA